MVEPSFDPDSEYYRGKVNALIDFRSWVYQKGRGLSQSELISEICRRIKELDDEDDDRLDERRK